MEFKQIIEQMTVETYSGLKLAVEIGKWADGRILTAGQRETSLQAIIAYEVQHNFKAEDCTGFVDTGNSDCHDDDGNYAGGGGESPLAWK